MNLSERVKQAREHAGLKQKELADMVGITQTAISQLESGKTQRSTFLVQIAIACKVNTRWLASGTGEMLADEPIDEDFIRRLANLTTGGLMDIMVDVNDHLAPQLIRTWDDEACIEAPFLIEIGHADWGGKTIIEQSGNLYLRFRERTLKAHNVPIEQVVCVIVTGNSMEPVLQDGSAVAVNQAQTMVVDGKMYALNHKGQLRVKTLYRLPGGGMRLRSFNNHEHPDETYTPEETKAAGIEIIGQVFWGASFF